MTTNYSTEIRELRRPVTGYDRHLEMQLGDRS